MTSFFNFRDECTRLLSIFCKINLKFQGKYKYDQEIYDLFMESFDMFPIAAIINGKFLSIHGGLSPELRKVSFE
jgi:serine/threonine-protein phosphatase 2B catalytic subunit